MKDGFLLLRRETLQYFFQKRRIFPQAVHGDKRTCFGVRGGVVMLKGYAQMITNAWQFVGGQFPRLAGKLYSAQKRLFRWCPAGFAATGVQYGLIKGRVVGDDKVRTFEIRLQFRP